VIEAIGNIKAANRGKDLVCGHTSGAPEHTVDVHTQIPTSSSHCDVGVTVDGKTVSCITPIVP